MTHSYKAPSPLKFRGLLTSPPWTGDSSPKSRAWQWRHALFNVLLLFFAQRREGWCSAMGALGGESFDSSKIHSSRATFPFVGTPSKSSADKIQKRSYQRALRRLQQHGFCWYRGKIHNSLHGLPPAVHKQQTSDADHHAPRPRTGRRLRCFLWNSGHFPYSYWNNLITPQELDIAILVETKCVWSSEWSSNGFHFLHFGAKNAGIMVAVSQRVGNPNNISFRSIIDGRLVHCRVHFGNYSLDLVVGYQHVWSGDRGQADNIAMRLTFWQALDQLLRELPRRNHLILAGDFNTDLLPAPRLVGQGMHPSAWKSNHHRTHKDQDRFQNLVHSHGGADKFHAVLMKHIRFIANSPRHVTRESNINLFARIDWDLPLVALYQHVESVRHRHHLRQQELAHEDICHFVPPPPNLFPFNFDLKHYYYPVVANNSTNPNLTLTYFQAASPTVPETQPEHINSTPNACAFTCPECHRSFQDRSSLKIHCTKMRHPMLHSLQENPQFNQLRDAFEGVPQCSHCFQPFTKWRSLRNHIENMHCPHFVASKDVDAQPLALQPQVVTLVRNRNFPDILADRHLTDQMASNCTLCNAWHDDTTSLSRHLRTKHKHIFVASREHVGEIAGFANLGSGKGMCPLCHHPMLQLQKHQCIVVQQLAVLANFVHHAGTNTPLQSEDDARTLTVNRNKDPVVLAALVPPTPPPAFVCPDCTFPCVSALGLRQHRKSTKCQKAQKALQSQNEKQWSCPHCPKSYTTQKRLKQHVQRLHADCQKVELFKFCKTSTCTQGTLEIHFRFSANAKTTACTDSFLPITQTNKPMVILGHPLDDMSREVLCLRHMCFDLNLIYQSLSTFAMQDPGCCWLFETILLSQSHLISYAASSLEIHPFYRLYLITRVLDVTSCSKLVYGLAFFLDQQLANDQFLEWSALLTLAPGHFHHVVRRGLSHGRGYAHHVHSLCPTLAGSRRAWCKKTARRCSSSFIQVAEDSHALFDHIFRKFHGYCHQMLSPTCPAARKAASGPKHRLLLHDPHGHWEIWSSSNDGGHCTPVAIRSPEPPFAQGAGHHVLSGIEQPSQVVDGRVHRRHQTRTLENQTSQCQERVAISLVEQPPSETGAIHRDPSADGQHGNHPERYHGMPQGACNPAVPAVEKPPSSFSCPTSVETRCQSPRPNGQQALRTPADSQQEFSHAAAAHLHPAKQLEANTIGQRGALSHERDGQRTPMSHVVLSNPHNWCWLNSLVQSLGHSSIHCMRVHRDIPREESAWIDAVVSAAMSGPIQVSKLWDLSSIEAEILGLSVHQQDVGEIVPLLLTFLRANVADSAWHLRSGGLILDLNDKTTPLRLCLPQFQRHKSELQHLITTWHEDMRGLQALASPSKMLCIQLLRFNNALEKRFDHVYWFHDIVLIPVFDLAPSQHVRWYKYHIVGGITHEGDNLLTGHYRAFSKNCSGFDRWDDGSVAVRSQAWDLLFENFYLLWLILEPGHHI